MATLKQKEAVKKIVENRGNISRSMMEVGYEPNTAKNPKNLTNSKGFKELCAEVGLTDELVTVSLVEDIKAKPGNRKAELELAAKILGLLKEAPIQIRDNVVVMLLQKYGLSGGEDVRQIDGTVQEPSKSDPQP